MNCTQFHNRLDDFIDGTLTGLPEEGAQEHFQQCPECRRLVANERRLRALLRDLPVEPPSPGFAARALRQARQRHNRPGRGAFAAGFGSAAAIALTIWAVAGRMEAPAPVDEPAGIRLAVAEQRQVNLVFEVPMDIAGAELAMELPANVELAGYPGRKMLTWRTDLARGRNVLSLPIVGRAGAEGELIARISYGSKEQQFRVHLNVADPQALHLGAETGRA